MKTCDAYKPWQDKQSHKTYLRPDSGKCPHNYFDFMDAEHRTNPRTRELAPVEKSIYSLIDLRAILFGCNRRCLEHLSALDDFSAGIRALDRLTKPRRVKDKTVKGINFFDPLDNALLHALQG